MYKEIEKSNTIHENSEGGKIKHVSFRQFRNMERLFI